jgi:hypothetical protein
MYPCFGQMESGDVGIVMCIWLVRGKQRHMSMSIAYNHYFITFLFAIVALMIITELYLSAMNLNLFIGRLAQ